MNPTFEVATFAVGLTVENNSQLRPIDEKLNPLHVESLVQLSAHEVCEAADVCCLPVIWVPSIALEL